MNFLLFIVIVLLLLAVLDLVVGVSNDAVNFLNSAIGSKVATFKTIVLIAALGVILGSVFSSGIMEIARKGIFYPQFFTFDVILIVFLAVMLTDVILLDVFNSLGLPTSTTVSIIFELLGASFVAGILFSYSKGDAVNEIFKYINFESTRTIISGIFLSIIIAFTTGVIVQYFCRLLFTFNYEKNLAKYGALFSGVGITSIFYFLLIKGLKGTTLISASAMDYIKGNTPYILLITFIVVTAILFLLQKYAKINPLKIVVLAGTFSLAMAFAGNDLVNFIGVPITGLLAYQNWVASGVASDMLYQDYLTSNDIIVPNYMLIIAGIIMALTMWFSAKAKKVTETEINLSRQDEGEERFKPNFLARKIVNSTILFGNMVSVIIPTSISDRYQNSFLKSKLSETAVIADQPAFDLVRASVNLVLSSILIAFATSMKLPLSTTYVTFMVAMGTSLSDNAWGRESAVYRVAGVLNVIGGWFVTAFVAFSISGLLAGILYLSGEIGAYLLIAAVFIYLIYSHVSFSNNEKKTLSATNKLSILESDDLSLIEKYKRLVANVIQDVREVYTLSLKGLVQGDLKKLKKANEQIQMLEDQSKKIKVKSIKYIKKLNSADKEIAEVILLSSDFIEDIIHSTKAISEETEYFIKNLHLVEDKHFLKTIIEVKTKMDAFLNLIVHTLHTQEIDDIEAIRAKRNELRSFINAQLEIQTLSIKTENLNTKQSILQTQLFLQSRDIQAVAMRICKMFNSFYKPV